MSRRISTADLTREQPSKHRIVSTSNGADHPANNRAVIVNA